jgi:hypothetical protein
LEVEYPLAHLLEFGCDVGGVGRPEADAFGRVGAE